MPFSANQVLIPPTKLDGPEDIKSAGGTVAATLGALFKKEYNQNRPMALTFRKAEALKESKKLKGKEGLKWSVVVDKKVKEIHFVILDGTKQIDSATIFSGFDELKLGAEVINLDQNDKVMKAASAKQAKKFNGKEDVAKYNKPGENDKEEKTDLAEINSHKRIVLCGHGGGGADVQGKMYTAKKFGGRDAKQIVNFLLEEGLQKDYKGTIYLSGCHTAAGYGDPESFANVVHKLLAKEGYKKLSVAGTPGIAQTKADGEKTARIAAIEKDIVLTHGKSQKLLATLTKAKAESEKELKEARAELKAIEDQYASVRALLLDAVPPEAQDTFEAKLLNPIKENRDAMIPALKELEAADKRLEGAVKSETAYFEKLSGILKKKKELQEGKIKIDDYKKEVAKDFGVEEWWGHFGPAKATRAKVSKSSSALGKIADAFKAKFKKAKA